MWIIFFNLKVETEVLEESQNEVDRVQQHNGKPWESDRTGLKVHLPDA